ncbi:MFS transporter [Nocardia transvalensis]|uniref:MFS transporter n=1 Tax=Nocardia transvalensis TaxID=37333 RepID=UPI001893084B|nr:MFS transporter [Nocardia transvalensis]MBF6332260.1 MFS transporter [Nocardia transvalensis]
MNPLLQPVPVTRTPTPPTRAWIGLIVLATAQFLVVLTTSIVNVALPDIGRGLELSPVGLSWVVNGYVLAFGALLLLGGRLGDVFGRRRVFLTGTAIFTACSIAAGLAPTAAVLLAARVGQGVGAALLAPTALALVLALFPAGKSFGDQDVHTECGGHALRTQDLEQSPDPGRGTVLGPGDAVQIGHAGQGRVHAGANHVAGQRIRGSN